MEAVSKKKEIFTAEMIITGTIFIYLLRHALNQFIEFFKIFFPVTDFFTTDAQDVEMLLGKKIL